MSAEDLDCMMGLAELETQDDYAFNRAAAHLAALRASHALLLRYLTAYQRRQAARDAVERFPIGSPASLALMHEDRDARREYQAISVELHSTSPEAISLAAGVTQVGR